MMPALDTIIRLLQCLVGLTLGLVLIGVWFVVKLARHIETFQQAAERLHYVSGILAEPKPVHGAVR
jgi:hypothetical protein